MILKLSTALLLLAGVFLVGNTPSIFAATGILKQINFQGKVVNKTVGTNIADGDYSFTFTIYDAASSGTNLWTETKTITVTNGIFQTLLGSGTALPSSIDFNTDNLYLGINFNSDGEMSPRVRLAAVPYAFNALKVAGLTVTDTTGTLTIPNSTTVSFADSFTTAGANALTLTTTGATNVTLPTTGTLTTLTGTEVLTNKSIGSTGLTFSGATTDITTGTDEALTIGANGTGDIVFGTDADTTISFSSQFNTCTALETVAGVLTCGSDASGGGGGSLQGAYDGDDDGSDATITLNSTDGSFIVENPSSSGTGSSFTFKLSQANTTAAVSVLDIMQSSNAANGINLTANAIDGETGFALTTNALTSGRGLTITSTSTAFTGALQEIVLSGSDAANTGNLLKLSNTGTANANTTLAIDHRATGTNNLAMRVDDESGDTTPFIIDGDGRVGIGTSSISGSTERLLQVGSATNRGNMVAYGEVVSKGYSKITDLTGIKDVYLYDTSADSDGGKWIDWATTDKLSWYSETLDDGPSEACDVATDDRCYTTNFPRKAILAVTNDALYIFDAATNDMWMKFSQNASGYALGVDTGNDPTSVTALNGVIYVGTNGASQGGLYVFDFVNDRMWNIDGTDRSAADVGISGRNGAVSYASDNTTAFDIATVGTISGWEDINDVSATFITGSTTAIAAGAAANTSPGSGQTFVGLATDSGITVINMTAQKVLQYSDATDNDYTAIALTRRGRLYALNTTLDQVEQWNDFDSDKVSEVNGTYTQRWDESVGPALWTSVPDMVAGNPDALEVIERGSLAEDTSDILYVGHSLGMTEIHTHSTVTNGWSKFFDTTRQTMLMPNAIDMALMLDDSSGTLANDISFNNTDMSIKGTPTLGVSGVRGKAIQFDNTDDFLCSDANQDGTCDVDTSFNMSTTGWTLSMWFKHSTTAPASGVDMLFEKCVTTTPAQATGCVAAYMTTTGVIVVANDDDATWTQGSSYDITSTSSLTYNDNQWHQLIITRTNANDVDTFIDGNPLNLSTATGNTLTVDGSQIVTIGASCNTTTGAACAAANATNFWDGVIDDVTFSAGATTVATLSPLQARRFYNDARPLTNKRVITVADATGATNTTIADSGEAWIPNEFAGMLVTLTEGTGVGQTRRISGNTATTLTVTPAFQTTPDTTTDFEIDPEALYGSSNSVAAIGITGEAPLGQARQMCVGTDDGADGGGVTCYNHQAGPNIVADIFHGDTDQTDDALQEWTGTDFDDIRSIDMSGKALIVGSRAHTYIETEDVRLGQGLDYLANQLFNIRGEMINDGILLTGSSALEVGFTGGADLAEWYYSDETILPGSLVAIDSASHASIRMTEDAYQGDMLGVVSTAPGLTLGEHGPGEHAVALVGRVPVLVTNENGDIRSGDRITSAITPGFGMKATGAGRVIGVALEAMSDAETVNCPADALSTSTCARVLVFVNLSDYNGLPLQEAMNMVSSQSEDGEKTQDDILPFLAQWRARQEELALQGKSELFTDRVITLDLFADQIHARNIKADSIEGLQIFTDNLSSLQAKLDQLELQNASQSGVLGASASASPVATPNATLLTSVLEFFQTIAYKGNVMFFGRPTFNNDSAGFAVIKSGASQVKVTFTLPFESKPVVVASPDKNVSFSVTELDTQKFFIRLSAPASEDTKFSWTATSVEKANTFESEPVAPQTPTPIPVSSPSATLTPTPVASASALQSL